MDNNKNNLKIFFIKLVSIVVAIVLIINITYNLILADKMEMINQIFSITEKENINKIKNKIRIEINKGLQKDKILNEEDKEIILKIYKKIKNELKD